MLPSLASLLIVTAILVSALLSSSPHNHHHYGAAAISLVANKSLAKGVDRVVHVDADYVTNTAFLACWTSPGIVSKVNMRTMNSLGTVILNAGEDFLSSVVFSNDQLFVSTHTEPQAYVVRVSAAALNRLDRVEFAKDSETKVAAAVLLRTDGGATDTGVIMYAMDTKPIRLVKVQVVPVFQRVSASATALQNGEENAGLFTATSAFVFITCLTSPGRIVRLTVGATTSAIQTTAPLRTAGLELPLGQDNPGFGLSLVDTRYPSSPAPSAAAVAAGDRFVFFFLFGAPGGVVKMRADPFEHVSFFEFRLSSEKYPSAAVFDAQRGTLYVALATWPAILLRLNVTGANTTDGGVVHTATSESVWHSGSRYFSTALRSGKDDMLIATDTSAASAVKFDFVANNYSASAQTVFRGGESRVAVMKRRGEYLYAATDTRPAMLIKLHGETLLHMKTLTLPLGEDYARVLLLDKFGYAHLGTCTALGQVVTINTLDLTRTGVIVATDNVSEQCYHTGIFAPRQELSSSQIMYMTSYWGARIIAFRVAAGGSVQRLHAVPFPSRAFSAPSHDENGYFGIYGTFHSVNARVIKYKLGGGVSDVDQLTVPEGQLRDNVVVGQYVFFCATAKPAGLVKVHLNSGVGGTMQRIGRLSAEFYSAVHIGGPLGVFGGTDGQIVQINLDSLTKVKTITVPNLPGGKVLEAAVLGPPGSNRAYFSTFAAPSWIVSIDVTLPDSSSSASPDLVPIIVASCTGLFFIGFCAYVAFNSNSAASRERGGAEQQEQDVPMLQVPRQTVMVVHAGMTAPDRRDIDPNASNEDLNDDPYNEGVYSSSGRGNNYSPVETGGGAGVAGGGAAAGGGRSADDDW